MKNSSERTIDLLLAAACGIALYWFVDPTTRAAILTAGLCVFALRSPWPDAAPSISSQDDATNSPAGDLNLTTPLCSEHIPADLGGLVRQMIARGRTALLLRGGIAESLSDEDLARARDMLDETTALVPGGPVIITPRGVDTTSAAPHRDEFVTLVEPFLLDRYPVTNRAYQAFVDDGGYRQMSLWDAQIWPAVLQFVDRTGEAGPKYWERGRYPAEKGEHPVVGVSWFEAAAYARWAGKRLPSDAEWVKAAAWPVAAEGARPNQKRYPWGDAMDRRLANLWSSNGGQTTPVDAFPAGGSVNGIYDLVGNVWEWTASAFDEFAPSRLQWETAKPLKSIRGGAFDTYFDTQAATTFAGGEEPMARRPNIGFRCATTPTEPTLFDHQDGDIAGDEASSLEESRA